MHWPVRNEHDHRSDGHLIFMTRKPLQSKTRGVGLSLPGVELIIINNGKWHPHSHYSGSHISRWPLNFKSTGFFTSLVEGL